VEETKVTQEEKPPEIPEDNQQDKQAEKPEEEKPAEKMVEKTSETTPPSVDELAKKPIRGALPTPPTKGPKVVAVEAN